MRKAWLGLAVVVLLPLLALVGLWWGRDRPADLSPLDLTTTGKVAKLRVHRLQLTRPPTVTVGAVPAPAPTEPRKVVTLEELDEATQAVQSAVVNFQAGAAVTACITETMAVGDPPITVQVTSVTGPEGLLTMEVTSETGVSSDVLQCLEDVIWSLPSEGLPIDADLVTVNNVEVDAPEGHPQSHADTQKTFASLRTAMPQTIAALKQAYAK